MAGIFYLIVNSYVACEETFIRALFSILGISKEEMIMYGAIFGDVIGSRFEFDRGGKTKEFKLFTERDSLTDDTVMTIAVGEGLMNAGKYANVEDIKKSVIESMQLWGHKYPNAGYGGRFFGWLFNGKKPKPYGSYGNGSAMRVSAVGWLYDSLERTREVARATAEVTHNHPEGIKGAECTATVMFMARNGCTKEEIFDYITEEFGYDLSETLDQMRERHEHVESCQDSLPKALRSFWDGDSYEDVVRNAVSLGGDTDTLAAIAGAMAEAFYEIPISIMLEGKTFIPEDMQVVLDRFDMIIDKNRREDTDEEPYENNKYIKMAVELFYKTREKEEYSKLLDVLVIRAKQGGEAPTPMVDKNYVLDSMNWKNMTVGDNFSFDQELRLTIDKMQDAQGNIWTPLYTDDEEVNKGETTNICINVSILEILREAFNYEKSQGLVINPFGQAITIPKEVLGIVLEEIG